MKNTFKSAATIFGVCLVGVSLLYLVFVFRPLHAQTQVLDDEHSANLEQIKEYDAYIRESEKIESDIGVVEAKIAALNTEQPLSGQYIANDINNGFMECELLLKTITMSDEAIVQPQTTSSKGDLLYSVTSSVAFEASQEDLVALIDYFESNSKAAYYITNLSVSSMEENMNSVSLVLTAYYYAPLRNTPANTVSSDTTAQETKDANAVFSDE